MANVGEGKYLKELYEALDGEPVKQVGDINSTEKGSGARYNVGKAPLELIPFRVLALVIKDKSLKDLLLDLDKFQFTGNAEYLETAIITLVDFIPDCARVFNYGKHKYAEWNWLKGMKWSIPLACIGRHIGALDEGFENDAESGESHWVFAYPG